jgi:aminopeptidase N
MLEMRPESGMNRRRRRIGSAVLPCAVFYVLLLAPPPVVASPAPSPVQCCLAKERAALAAEDFPEPPRGHRGYDVLRYDLELRIDPVTSSVAGTVAIRLASVGQALEQVLLDLVPELTCTQATAQETPLAFAHTGDSLMVRLDPPIAAGDTMTLHIGWEGRPPRHGELRAGLLFRRHDSGTRTDLNDDQPTIFSVSQPWSAHSWWPCKDNPADKAQVSLILTVPDSLRAVSNGTLISDEPADPGWRRTRWQENYPIAPYLVAVAISNYESWSEDCFVSGADRSVPLEYHVFPSDVANARLSLALTCDMMEFMTNLAGPYPFAGEKYAQVGIKWIGAMENQTVTALPQFMFTGNDQFETTVLHELSHHWFGNNLTPAAWSDIWLNEGFARYCEALWVEETYGRAAYNDFMRQIGPARHENLFLGEGTLDDPNPIINLFVYNKGAHVLHMLRRLMGDEVFFDFLREYASGPERAFGNVTTADLIAVAEQFAGRSMAGFFDPWLSTEQAPEVTATWRVLPSGSNLGQVSVALRQEQELLFEVPVPVGIYFSGGMRVETARLTRREQVFSFTVPGAVDSVSIDPGGLALLRSATTPPPVLTIRGPAPNPVGAAGGRFDLFLTRPATVLLKAYDARGRLLHTRTLGSLAATGLATDPLTVPHTISWPAGASGRAMPASGVYWLEFLAGNLRVVKKAVFIR